MSTLRVGQRCKIVDAEDLDKREWIGCEVTILQLPGWNPRHPEDYEITRPAAERVGFKTYGALRHHLAPLTDPLAEQFIARLEKLGREPVSPVQIPEKVTK